MAFRDGPITRSVFSCLAFVLLTGIVIGAGANTSIVVGGILLLGGFASLGDRRRDMFSGFGAMALGTILLVVGLAMK